MTLSNLKSKTKRYGYVTVFEKRCFHTYKIKLTILLEIDCWFNALSFSTVWLAKKSWV